MPRLTISLPNNIYNRLSSLAMQYDDSMSNIINRMIQLGMIGLDDEHHKMNGKNKANEVDSHCHQLIIQMNAMIKNLSAETLKFNAEDFEKLRQASLLKYNELSSVN